MAPNDSKGLRLFNKTKITELKNYKDKYQRTLTEWKKFVAGRDNIDTSVVPAEVLNAWRRCRDAGIDPMQLPQKKILTGEPLEALLLRNKDFIDVSRPYLSNLYQFLKGSGFHVVLFCREGYLLKIMGDHDRAELMREAGGVVGALWAEASAGHNVIGAIVQAQKPVQLFASQSYIKDYHGETGSGAPIFSPQGELLGGIALSARNFRVNPHTLGMAVAAAYAVENELRTRKAFADLQTSYRFQQTVIASVTEAMIVVDHRGAIAMINDPAKKLFALTSPRIEGQSLRAIWARKNPVLLKLIEDFDRVTDREVRIFSRGAWNDYTVTLTPIISTANQHIGKMIVLNEIKRARTMIAKMVGARAIFHFDDICGRNPKFLITMEQAKMVAQSDSNALLLGKSGTGKDIFAQAIHNASRRSDGPYLAINCGAIPRDLIANELFGHEEGAFTGSRRGGNQGKFELADGGTIFLDEIAELPLELQAVLLRVIEDKSITRIGGKQSRKVDVRIITATNKNLREEIAKGNFREDLFYRINVFGIEMMPLCERPDDILLLTQCFIKKFEKLLGKRIRHVDDRISEAFLHYPWPGNVRELQNVIERMMNFARGNELTYDLIPGEMLKPREMPDRLRDMEAPGESEKRIIQRMLDLKFKKTEIAERLHLSRATLYRKMKKYGLSATT